MLDDHVGVFEDLAQELLHDVGVDPGRAEPGVDLGRGEVGRDDLAQGGDVGVPAAAAVGGGGVAFGGGLGGGELDAHVAGQVLRCRDQPLGAAVGVGEHEPGEGVAGVFLAAAEQPGDLVEVDLAVGVQADRDGVGRGVRAQARGAGCDHPPGHDRGLAGGADGGVEVLEGVDGGGVRVEFEAALWWGDAGQAVLAGDLVDAAGAAVGDPVDRPPPFGVGVVAGVELAAQAVDVLGVLGGGRLGGQQRHGGVTQPEQGGEFAWPGWPAPGARRAGRR